MRFGHSIYSILEIVALRKPRHTSTQSSPLTMKEGKVDEASDAKGFVLRRFFIPVKRKNKNFSRKRDQKNKNTVCNQRLANALLKTAKKKGTSFAAAPGETYIKGGQFFIQFNPTALHSLYKWIKKR
ncbi:hypothetical protein EWH99_04715 [Sporolactobacillus sp. THM7-7]|nr:hypothetical protein EWH99_04715 [Sporolactobacillus sp. THM7-7]